MDKENVEKLLSGVNAILEQEGTSPELLWKYKECVNLLLGGIRYLKSGIALAGFKDRSEEIWFYKEGAPKVWGLYIYYNRMVEIEVWRKTRSPEKFRALLRAELKEVELFPEKHSICAYYYEGRSDRDEQYFTRQHKTEWADGDMGVFLDTDFTIGAYWLSQMRANEALRRWLTMQLEELNIASDSEFRRVRKLPCLAKPVEIIEVFKAFHLKNWFGKTTFKEVMNWAQEAFDVNIANYDIVLQGIERRKSGQTKCLDEAREAFKEWMANKG